MGLFDKKYCDICGAKIGLLGNRKLENGNLCKDCARKLSPFFSERRSSTVEEIRQQLEYREQNKQVVAAFNPTKVISADMTLYIDEDKGQWLVTRARSWRDDNPDVLTFSQVIGCDLDVDETKTELMREDKDGNEVSYNPPHYNYTYDFYVTIHVNSPYFSQIRIQINDDEVSQRGSIAYRQNQQKAEEIKQTLMNAKQAEKEAIAAANAPKQPVVCSACGATTVPDARNCCEYCGSPLKA